jgi:hypothetical protein
MLQCDLAAVGVANLSEVQYLLQSGMLMLIARDHTRETVAHLNKRALSIRNCYIPHHDTDILPHLHFTLSPP